MGSSFPAVAKTVLALLVVCGFAARTALAGGEFSTLPRSLVVTASPKEGQVLKAGEDTITVSWTLNQTFRAGAAVDAAYKKVKVRLCYAPESQKERMWRKTENDLKKDKTCQFGVTVQPYIAAAAAAANAANAGKEDFKYLVEREVPTATYFIRAYVLDAGGAEVAYGQTTNDAKTSHLFKIQGITGRHASLDIAAACFSAFSVVSLFVFFWAEKRSSKKK